MAIKNILINIGAIAVGLLGIYLIFGAVMEFALTWLFLAKIVAGVGLFGLGVYVLRGGNISME